jgi:hypothetical protein
MSHFRKKLLLFIMFMLIIGCGYIVFIRTITDPQAMKGVPEGEKIEDSMARIYENFLHTTKYSYQIILESGTNYNNQERVFVELTKKMKDLNTTQGPDYEALRNKLLEEIKKNQDAFKSFYLKVAKLKPDELKKQIEARNKQYDIILESKD